MYFRVNCNAIDSFQSFCWFSFDHWLCVKEIFGWLLLFQLVCSGALTLWNPLGSTVCVIPEPLQLNCLDLCVTYNSVKVSGCPVMLQKENYFYRLGVYERALHPPACVCQNWLFTPCLFQCSFEDDFFNKVNL